MLQKKSKAPAAPQARVKSAGRTAAAAVSQPAPVPVDPSSPMTCTVGKGPKQFALQHANLVNNTDYSDVSFVISGPKGKETVAAHAFVLLGRKCGALLQASTLVSKVDKKGGATVVTIAEAALTFCNTPILLLLLRWVYTGETKAVSVSDDALTLIGLSATLSAAGLDGTLLEYVAEQRVQSMLNLGNVHLLLARAYEFRAERVLDFCKRFAYEHWGDFISDKAGCRRFSVELLSELSAANAKGDWKAHAARTAPADPIIEHYRAMSAVEPDLAIVPGGGGDGVPCHRAVVAAFSDSLHGPLAAALDGQARKRSNSKYPELTLASDNGAQPLRTAAAAEALVAFMYSGHTAIAPLVAVELVHALADYRLVALEMACEYAVVNGIDAATAFPILSCTFLPTWVTRAEMGALRQAATDHIVRNFRAIDLNTLRGLPPEVFHALQALQRANLRPADGTGPAIPPKPDMSSSSLSGSRSSGMRLPPDAAPQSPPEHAFVLSPRPAPPSDAPAAPPKPSAFVADGDDESGASENGPDDEEEEEETLFFKSQ